MSSQWGDVCYDETNEWRKCIEDNLTKHKTVEATCTPLQRSFDQCVQSWRTAHAEVQVRGDNPGDPPPQCQAHSCLVGACLRATSFDFERCEPPVKFFKHCVKALYGSEFVD